MSGGLRSVGTGILLAPEKENEGKGCQEQRKSKAFHLN
jgi:hypothetical protein